MKCTRFAGGVVCGPDVTGASVEVNGRTVYFDFDEMFGPLLTTKSGRPLARQPVSERHPFWPAFEAWDDARRGLPPKCSACGGTGVAAARLSRRVAIARPCTDCGGKGRRAAAAPGSGR